MSEELERKAFERWLPDELMPLEFSHRYLFKRDGDGDYEHDFVRNYWRGWLGHSGVARAAIWAMREPTREMCEAGSSVTWWNGKGEEEWEESVTPYSAAEIFRAMIDAATPITGIHNAATQALPAIQSE